MDSNRRDFLATSGIITAAVLAPMQALAQNTNSEPLGQLTKHKLMALPYKFDALEPHIDAKTVELHYTKHHNGYLMGLNKAEEELAKTRSANDYSMIQYWEKQLAFHGAGNYLHEIYWKTMKANAGGNPKGKITVKISEDFGTFNAFKAQFTAAATTVEGSGWVILGLRKSDKRLLILQVENHQKLTTWDILPLLCIDVWEHAYYLKYQNKRADYINAWWNLVNWDEVEKNYGANR